MESFTLESPSHSENGWPFDPHIPFYAHINKLYCWRPSTSPVPVSLQREFHQFSRLPTELQLRVLQLCDHQTLFWLMQTCSSIRSLAKSLFWSCKSVWYYVNSVAILLELIARSRGHSPESFAQCPIFRNQVQQIELVLGRNYDPFWSQLPGHESKQAFDQPCFTQATAKLFIHEVLRLYPSIKRVVIIDKNILPGFPSPRFDARRVEEASILARTFPPYINVCRSTVMKKHGHLFPYERALYQWSPTSQWLQVESNWTRQRVIPPKVPIKGVVGEFLQLVSREEAENINNRGHALEFIRIEIFEKYHFGGEHSIPFKCLKHKCHREFRRLGEYSNHLLESGSWEDHGGWSVTTNRGEKSPEYPPLLPRKFKDSLTTMAMEILEDGRRYKAAWAQLREAWGNTEPEIRLRYADAFLDQLKHDPVLYSAGAVNTPRERSLWHHLQETWDRFDAENEMISTSEGLGS
jgi:F-box associated protein